MQNVHNKKKHAVVSLCLILIMMLMVGCGEKLQKEQETNKEQAEMGNKQPDGNKKDDQSVNQEQEGTDALDKDKDEEDKDDTKENELSTEEEVKPVEIDYQAVKPNEVGHIMVIMYHGIIDNYPYHVTEEQFLEDLTYMYENGYRPISMRDYLDNNITVEAGMTPIVLTFDDGLSSTFSLTEENGKLVPAKGTAVEIMERFAKEHPDFGKGATFYINGGKIFEGAGTVEERLNWLVDNGYGLGNHTETHKHLGKSSVTSRVIMSEIGKVDKIIKEAVPNYVVDSLTYPFGARPKDALRAFIKEGEYDGGSYNYQAGFREGPSRSYYAPIHTKFDPYNIARARGSKGEDGDMWFFFKYYENNPGLKYISDGRPDRVAITKNKEDYVNKEKLGDAQIYIYDLEK